MELFSQYKKIILVLFTRERKNIAGSCRFNFEDKKPTDFFKGGGVNPRIFSSAHGVWVGFSHGVILPTFPHGICTFCVKYLKKKMLKMFEFFNLIDQFVIKNPTV